MSLLIFKNSIKSISRTFGFYLFVFSVFYAVIYRILLQWSAPNMIIYYIGVAIELITNSYVLGYIVFFFTSVVAVEEKKQKYKNYIQLLTQAIIDSLDIIWIVVYGMDKQVQINPKWTLNNSFLTSSLIPSMTKRPTAIKDSVSIISSNIEVLFSYSDILDEKLESVLFDLVNMSLYKKIKSEWNNHVFNYSSDLEAEEFLNNIETLNSSTIRGEFERVKGNLDIIYSELFEEINEHEGYLLHASVKGEFDFDDFKHKVDEIAGVDKIRYAYNDSKRIVSVFPNRMDGNKWDELSCNIYEIIH